MLKKCLTVLLILVLSLFAPPVRAEDHCLGGVCLGAPPLPGGPVVLGPMGLPWLREVRLCRGKVAQITLVRGYHTPGGTRYSDALPASTRAAVADASSAFSVYETALLSVMAQGWVPASTPKMIPSAVREQTLQPFGGGMPRAVVALLNQTEGSDLALLLTVALLDPTLTACR